MKNFDVLVMTILINIVLPILAACRRESDVLGTNSPTGLKRPLITAKQA